MRAAIHEHQEAGKVIWKGIVAGLAGGLVAAWTMNQFQAGLSKLSERTKDDGKRHPKAAPKGDDATVKAAAAISESVANHKLTKREKRIAGPAIHYLFGSTMGALYGVAAEMAPVTATAWGLPFGTALWLGADEIGVPAAGLSTGAAKVSTSTHASALASHLVYGATADAVRRLVRLAL